MLLTYLYRQQVFLDQCLVVNTDFFSKMQCNASGIKDNILRHSYSIIICIVLVFLYFILLRMLSGLITGYKNVL